MDLACAFEGCSWKEWLGPLIYVCYLILWRKWNWKRQDDHYFVQLLCLSEWSFAKASEIYTKLTMCFRMLEMSDAVV